MISTTNQSLNFDAWSKIASGLATLIGAVVAVWGISAWRREHTGKRKAELAEETLAAFYQAADVLRHIRNPMGWTSEWTERKPAPGETPAEKHARDNANVVFVRYNQNSEVFVRLRATRYRFRALLGDDAARPFEDLNKLLNDVFNAAQRLSRLWAREHVPDEQLERHSAQIEKYEAIFWDHDENDEINRRLGAVIETIERTCRRVIAGRDHWAPLTNMIERAGKVIEQAKGEEFKALGPRD